MIFSKTATVAWLFDFALDSGKCCRFELRPSWLLPKPHHNRKDYSLLNRLYINSVIMFMIKSFNIHKDKFRDIYMPYLVQIDKSGVVFLLLRVHFHS